MSLGLTPRIERCVVLVTGYLPEHQHPTPCEMGLGSLHPSSGALAMAPVCGASAEAKTRRLAALFAVARES